MYKIYIDLIQVFPDINNVSHFPIKLEHLSKVNILNQFFFYINCNNSEGPQVAAD